MISGENDGNDCFSPDAIKKVCQAAIPKIAAPITTANSIVNTKSVRAPVFGQLYCSAKVVSNERSVSIMR